MDFRFTYSKQLFALLFFIFNCNAFADTGSGEIEKAFSDPALYAATKKFGPVVIPMRKLPYNSDVLDSGVKAWSSWWYPKADREFTQPKDIFRSPILEKFDLFFKVNNLTTKALETEKKYERERPAPASWEGLCDAWAIASISHPEPKRSLSFPMPQVGNTQMPAHGVLSVFDLKGLLLKTYEGVPEDQFDFYGQKFLGNSNSWIHPDIFPDQFHRLVEVYLGEKKQPMIMDRDPGVEVWSVPIYKANFKVEPVKDRPNAVLIKMWLFTAGPVDNGQKDFVGTIEVIREYAYILSGDLDSSGAFLTVTRGEWTKTDRVDSRANHPDFIFVPKTKKIKRSSYNSEVDPEKVDLLLRNAIN